MATAILTSATLLTTQALAGWTDHGDGNVTGGTSGEWPFIYNGDTNLSWQVNLYVSTRDDGSVDPSTSSVTTGNGLATSAASTNWTDDAIHLKGGITIADQPLDNKDTSIPVYYYITPTPNDPITPPGTATPPTFTPTPPTGTKVKKVVIPTDKGLVVPNNPPADFPDPVGTPYKDITNPTNPGGTYQLDPDNPPDHILVECVQTDITDIIFRKTFADGKLRAIASITLDGCFAIHEIKVIQTDHLFVAMPYRTDSYGISHDIAHPIGGTARHELESAIINAYNDYIADHENLVNADYTA